MPRLAESESVCGPISAGAASDSRIFCATAAASLALDHLGEQDDELVAAVAAHRVRFAHRGLEAARRQLQHLVADGVAERIVDLLEVCRGRGR